MKTQTQLRNTIEVYRLMNRPSLFHCRSALNQVADLPALMLLFLTATSVFAGSATWNLNPANGEWETATNWTPATIPNGPNDTATFRISNTTDIVLKNDF